MPKNTENEHDCCQCGDPCDCGSDTFGDCDWCEACDFASDDGEDEY